MRAVRLSPQVGSVTSALNPFSFQPQSNRHLLHCWRSHTVSSVKMRTRQRSPHAARARSVSHWPSLLSRSSVTTTITATSTRTQALTHAVLRINKAAPCRRRERTTPLVDADALVGQTKIGRRGEPHTQRKARTQLGMLVRGMHHEQWFANDEPVPFYGLAAKKSAARCCALVRKFDLPKEKRPRERERAITRASASSSTSRDAVTIVPGSPPSHSGTGGAYGSTGRVGIWVRRSTPFFFSTPVYALCTAPEGCAWRQNGHIQQNPLFGRGRANPHSEQSSLSLIISRGTCFCVGEDRPFPHSSASVRGRRVLTVRPSPGCLPVCSPGKGVRTRKLKMNWNETNRCGRIEGG